MAELDRDRVLAALAELDDAHALVLTSAGDGIRMAHPFSAWPMGFVVRGGDRLWWGGCAWDSFGIVAALGERLSILTICPHCGRELSYGAGPQDPPDADRVVVRVPRPAAEWWDDVVATCTAIRSFCSTAHLECWLADTGEPPGARVELERLWQLALPWYGDRLDPDWRPRSLEQRQEMLERAGLRGPFWQLGG
ncbi:MAG: alkylmercury lyase [Solirubrobacterales bacterium]|nr:alkylmercury lyase [Solirubrobacterales bacterium]